MAAAAAADHLAELEKTPLDANPLTAAVPPLGTDAECTGLSSPG